MNLENLVLQNRSYRKFAAGEAVAESLLISLIDLARNTASSKNIQPIKYLPVTNKKEVDFLFRQLAWAKHLPGWDGPEPQQRPPAYLVMLMDTLLNAAALIDAGIAAQTILLGATEKGLGGCIIRTIDRNAVREFFHIPVHLEITLVIAIGKPRQEVRLTELEKRGNHHYYEDRNGIHYVPKRSLDELIFKPGKHSG